MSKPIPIPPKPSNFKFRRALFAYDSKDGDELNFKEGDLLLIVDWKTNPDWWRARLKDKEGLVPANYFATDQRPVNEGEELNPFLDACRRGNLELLEECLSLKVPINTQDITGNTALHYGCHGGHIDVVNRILEMPQVRLDIKNRDGEIPLHKAARKGHSEIVELLLQKKSPSSVADKDGMCPLDLATDPDTKAAILKVLGYDNDKSGYGAEDYGQSDSDDEKTIL